MHLFYILEILILMVI